MTLCRPSYTCLSLLLEPGRVSPGCRLRCFPCSPIVPGRVKQSSYPYKPECTTTAVGYPPPPPPPTPPPTSTSLLSFSPSSNCCCPNINPATAGAAIKRERARRGGYISKGTRLCHAQKTKIAKGGYPTSHRELWSYPGNAGLVLRGLSEGCRVDCDRS